MRVVLNTRVDDTASRVCIHRLAASLLERGVDARVNDWDSYSTYDVAVFMAYDEELDEARRRNPRIKVVLADPKQSSVEALDVARRADLLLVSSVEQRDVLLRLNRNVLIHYMFPPLPPVQPRRHTQEQRTLVAYHGNRVHLEAMRHSVAPALSLLARQREVELIAIYNVAALGKARLDVPGVRVQHVQWTEEYVGRLAAADIGIAPNELPLSERSAALELTAYDDPELMYEPFDHLVRFKASTNPGRFYPFAVAGLPVVSDFVPSAAQFLLDGESGFLASSPYGWFEALEALAASAPLRASLATALHARLAAAYDAQVDAFVEACKREPLPPPEPIAGAASAEQQLARLDSYSRPRGPVWRRALGRVRRRR
jgi:glycosyltransferase involved in cell wall biosynthesis